MKRGITNDRISNLHASVRKERSASSIRNYLTHVWSHTICLRRAVCAYKRYLHVKERRRIQKRGTRKTRAEANLISDISSSQRQENSRAEVNKFWVRGTTIGWKWLTSTRRDLWFQKSYMLGTSNREDVVLYEDDMSCWNSSVQVWTSTRYRQMSFLIL